MHDLSSDSLEAHCRRLLLDGVAVRQAMAHELPQTLVAAARVLADALAAGGKVLLFGNGGSASDAQHIAAELVGRFVSERAPLPAVALTADSAAVTAISNDYGFAEVFARQVRGLGRAGDVAVAISTSGRSPNVLAAARAARSVGMRVIGLTNAAGAELPSLCDVCICVPATVTARVQEGHITAAHVLCELVDALLFDGLPAAPTPAEDPTLSKVVSLDGAVALREAFRARGKRVVWTNGCFDVLHAGHVASLRACRAFGDRLIVGVNTDASVRRLKGDDRPVFDLTQRLSVLGALEMVDALLPFDDDTPVNVLSAVKPDVICKGRDYAPGSGRALPERAVVEAYGGQVAFLPLVEGLSTTRTLERLVKNA